MPSGILSALVLIILFRFSFPSKSKEIQFNIVHISDLLSRYDEVGWDTGLCYDDKNACSGGFCRLSKYMRRLERGNINVISLNTGNALGGSIYWDLYGIRGFCRMSKYLGTSVNAVLGSRELILDIMDIVEFLNTSTNIQYLGCNLRFPEYSQMKIVEHKIKKSIIQVIDGSKVGIIGFTSETIMQTAESKNNIEILEAIPEILTEANDLEKKGVNIILVFGCGSFEEAKNIVSQLPLVDIVIVGGIGGGIYTVEDVADRSKYPLEILLRSGRRSLILHNFNVGYSRYVGFLHATFNAEGFLAKFDGEMVYLNSSYLPNSNCLKNFNKLAAEDSLPSNKYGQDTMKKMMTNKIGCVIPVLDMLRYDCTRMECNLGNFIADALLQYIWQEFYFGGNADNIQVSLVPAYAVTSSINSTEVTEADIRHATSFDADRTISIFTINGKDLLLVLEEVASKIPGLHFLQVSGLQIHYDLRYPVGSRVVEANVLVNEGSLTIFRPVADVKDIHIITLTSLLKYNILSELNDKYTNNSYIKNKENENTNLDDVVSDYISKLKSFKRPCIEDRIIVDTATETQKYSKITLLSLLIIICIF